MRFNLLLLTLKLLGIDLYTKCLLFYLLFYTYFLLLLWLSIDFLATIAIRVKDIIVVIRFIIDLLSSLCTFGSPKRQIFADSSCLTFVTSHTPNQFT